MLPLVEILVKLHPRLCRCACVCVCAREIGFGGRVLEVWENGESTGNSVYKNSCVCVGA